MRRFINDNIIITLKNHKKLAEAHLLQCQLLIERKSYQANVTVYFRKLQPFDILHFLVHKLTKYIPFQAEEVATEAIITIRMANNVLPQFIVMDFVRLLVDGLCLQNRSGRCEPCSLCGTHKNCMAHLPACQVALQIRHSVLHLESAASISSFYNFSGSRRDKLLHLIFVDILRHTLDTLRASPSFLLAAHFDCESTS
jgi:hypothetical protein